MTNRPICPKGQRKPGSPCIFCENGSYCAHQDYCPATRRYENTGWRECRRMKGPAGDEGTILSQPAADTSFQKEALAAAAGTGDAAAAGIDVPQGTKKEVTKVGAKKSNRRKPRKG